MSRGADEKLDIAKPHHVVLLSYMGRPFVYFLLFMDQFTQYGGIYHFATAPLPSGVMPEQEK